MKLSAFLALTVPVLAMAPLPALADNEQMPQAGLWIKESIADLKPVSAPKKLRHAAPSAAPVRLRPFMANRYLPKERDLRRALVAEQAQMDTQALSPQLQPQLDPQQLSGNVSTYYNQQPSSPYDQYSMRNMLTARNVAAARGAFTTAMPVLVKQIKLARKQAAGTRLARMTPGQMPVLPEQLVPSAQIQPLIPEPPAQRTARRPDSMPLAMPKLNPQQQAMLDKMVEQNIPPYHVTMDGQVVGDTPESFENNGGASPLSLNPMQALMQSRCKANVPPARFGSWHNSSPVSGLAQAGFHSWLPVRSPAHYEYSRAPWPIVNKRKTSQHHAAAGLVSKQQQHQIARPNIAARSSSKATPILAAYPVYTSPHGSTY